MNSQLVLSVKSAVCLIVLHIRSLCITNEDVSVYPNNYNINTDKLAKEGDTVLHSLLMNLQLREQGAGIQYRGKKGVGCFKHTVYTY